MWGVTSPAPFPCTVTIVPPNKISEISPHFVCNFCQHVSRTTFCALFSLSLSLSLSLELRTYMVCVPSIHKPYIYFTIWHRALYRICHTTLSRLPCPLCCQFCQYSVEFFETPWMILAVSPARLFPVFFSLSIFSLNYCIENPLRPASKRPSISEHLFRSLHTHTHISRLSMRLYLCGLRSVRSCG